MNRPTTTPTAPAAAAIATKVPTLTGKYAVYVGTVPADFRPTGFDEVPETIEGARLLARGLDKSTAAAFLRIYNQRQADAGLPDRVWAFAVRRPEIPRHGTPARFLHDQAHERLLDALRHPGRLPAQPR